MLVGKTTVTPRRTLLLLADCYESWEAPAFESKAALVADTLKGPDLFPESHGKLRVYRADTYLKSSHNKKLASLGGCYSDSSKKTRFSTKYFPDDDGNCIYLDGNPSQVVTVLKTLKAANPSLPPINHVMVLVNFNKSVGTAVGGWAWVSADNDDLKYLALHEAGHFFGLHDEYENACNQADEVLNADAEPEVIRDMNVSTDPVSPPWRPSNGTLKKHPKGDCKSCLSVGPAASLGSFQGGLYTHCRYYRPYRDCGMRSPGVPFCLYCYESIRQQLL